MLLATEQGWQNCGYRYRIKANYSDGIYVTYGRTSLAQRCDGAEDYFHDLAVSPRFAFLNALADVSAAWGKRQARAFLADLRTHFSDKSTASPDELFWADIRF